MSFALLSELRKTLQKQEEETKQREKNIDELQNKNESLKSDLAKADKERKELGHKVGVVKVFHMVTKCNVEGIWLNANQSVQFT